MKKQRYEIMKCRTKTASVFVFPVLSLLRFCYVENEWLTKGKRAFNITPTQRQKSGICSCPASSLLHLNSIRRRCTFRVSYKEESHVPIRQADLFIGCGTGFVRRQHKCAGGYHYNFWG